MYMPTVYKLQSHFKTCTIFIYVIVLIVYIIIITLIIPAVHLLAGFLIYWSFFLDHINFFSNERAGHESGTTYDST